LPQYQERHKRVGRDHGRADERRTSQQRVGLLVAARAARHPRPIKIWAHEASGGADAVGLLLLGQRHHLAEGRPLQVHLAQHLGGRLVGQRVH